MAIKYDAAAREEIYKLAQKQCGRTNEIVVAMEECSELTKELAKDLRGMGKRDKIIEELADVFVMVESMRLAYNCKAEFDAAIQMKIERLKWRMESGWKT